MKSLKVTRETFCEMLNGLIVSGVTFEASELTDGLILVEFTGGY